MEQDYAIVPQTVDWAVRALGVAERRLGVRPRLHDPEGLLGRGDIFLFNHFARFETVFPPLYLYRMAGRFARSVAHGELFAGPLGPVLRALGAVPHTMPGLLPFLAAEILRGRKVVIFPEGGMIKDRDVRDAEGSWSVCSPSSKTRRPHHSGAAVLGLLVDACKARLRSLEERGDREILGRWLETLGLETTQALLQQAHQPTLLVPGTITFYPLQPPEQWTQRALDVFARLRGQVLSDVFAEEFLVESGLLFGKSDMDIRLGLALPARPAWSALERAAIDRIFARLQSLSELFDLTQNPERWVGKLTQRAVRYHADALRDQWSGRLYRLLTVNLGHLLATLCTLLVERGQERVERKAYFRVAYMALDRLRQVSDVHLHESLALCQRTRGLLQGQGEDLALFLRMAEGAGLWRQEGDDLVLSPKITQPLPPHRTRLENPIRLLTNEAAPVEAVRRAVSEALITETEMSALHRDQQLAWAMMAEQGRALAEDRQSFSGPEMAALNRQETATADPAPYFLLPPGVRPGVTQPLAPLGVLVVHGFLASPAELRPLGDRLHQRGFPVMGVRLSGHGTSPWDLRERRWQDWLASLYEGWRILQPFCEAVAVVGFSTGGTLALTLAAAHPEGLAGVVTIAAPVRFVDRRIGLVPWLHRLDEATRWRPSADQDGLSFRPNESEHPEVNYAHIPLAALYQLHSLTRALPRRLPQVHCPALVIQGDHDPVVDPASGQVIFDALGSRDKRLHWVPAQRHGLVYDQVGDTWEQVVGFLEMLRGRS